MLSLAVRNTKKLVRAQVKENNVRLGRFFTKKETAALMASFPVLPEKEEVRLLDPGAGTGILAAAMAERLAKSGTVRVIRLECFETDPLFLPMLRDNLERIRRKCRHDYKVKIFPVVREEDYVTAPRAGGEGGYDLVIMNPPRRLLPPGTPEWNVYADVCSGETDLCYLFLCAALSDLAPDGQAVALLPVVFSSGAYLQKLRHYCFALATPVRAHLFLRSTQSERLLDDARKNMILLFRAGTERPESMQISTAYAEDGTVHTMVRADYDSVLRERDASLLLLKSAEEGRIVEIMAHFPETLSSLHLRMKTGLTLESRYPDLLCDEPEPDTVPLIHPNHIQLGRIEFPRPGIRNRYLRKSVPSLLQKNKNMLFIKRVPAKSDKKPLLCGVYLASQLPHCHYISTHNKLNYIDYDPKWGDAEMDCNFLFGLYVVFNSSLYGKYYQVYSKSKQINATEFADLPLPSAPALRNMGARLAMCRVFSEKACDNILLSQMKSGKL